MRAEDTVARIGGDEFTILLETVVSREQAATAAERIIEALGRPFRIAGRTLHVKPSIGIALGSAVDATPEQLIHRADVAMYRAKESGVSAGYEFFDAGMELQAMDMLAFEQDLDEAVTREELELHYQPTVELATGRITGVEALLRWRHPRLGMLAPMQFIPLAEEAVDRPDRLLDDPGGVPPERRVACRGRERGQRGHVRQHLGPDSWRIRGSPRTVCAALADADLPASGLSRATEDSAMTNIDSALETLDRLKEVEVEIALDDFGTGHSSLGYLQRFPLDFLKIDRSFVAEMVESEESFAIVRALVALTHSLARGASPRGSSMRTSREAARARRRHRAGLPVRGAAVGRRGREGADRRQADGAAADREHAGGRRPAGPRGRLDRVSSAVPGLRGPKGGKDRAGGGRLVERVEVDSGAPRASRSLHCSVA